MRHDEHCEAEVTGLIANVFMLYPTKVRVVEGRTIDCSPLEAAVDLTSVGDTNLVL